MAVNLCAGKCVASAAENRIGRVGLLRWNGIKLVITTARTAQAQPQNPFSHVIDCILDGEVKFIISRTKPARDCEKTGGNNSLKPFLVRLAGHQVSCNLLADKLVVRFVL